MSVTIYVVFYYIHSEGRNTIFLEKQIYVVFCHNHTKERTLSPQNANIHFNLSLASAFTSAWKQILKTLKNLVILTI